MNKSFKIDHKIIGENQKTFIIAEMSANHLQDYDRAVEIIKKAAWAGADAIKLQTYTPDTITIDCEMSIFKLSKELFGMELLYINCIKGHIHHGNGSLN